MDGSSAGDELITAPSGTTYLLSGEKLFEYDGGGTGGSRARSPSKKVKKPWQEYLLCTLSSPGSVVDRCLLARVWSCLRVCGGHRSGTVVLSGCPGHTLRVAFRTKLSALLRVTGAHTFACRLPCFCALARRRTWQSCSGKPAATFVISLFTCRVVGRARQKPSSRKEKLRRMRHRAQELREQVGVGHGGPHVCVHAYTSKTVGVCVSGLLCGRYR